MKSSVKILGLSFFYHDAAAALIIDGVVVAAAQEERFIRVKHDESFPKHALEFCLRQANISVGDLDYIVFYEKPITKFDRLLTMYLNGWPQGIRSFLPAMQSWFGDKFWVEKKIRKTLGYTGKILFSEHHYSHAASSYYCSNFDDAVVVTMDGVGESDTTTTGYGKANRLQLTRSIQFPHSLGLLYSALTYYLGFKVNSAEYKVMGLAPYGNPEKFRLQFEKLITVRDDGSFEMNMKYFGYENGLTMTNNHFDTLFGGPARTPESELTQREKDIAATLQKVTEEIVLKIVDSARTEFPSRNLCLAGGVALNCVANGKILKTGWFDKIYVQPAAGDAGGAIGAALYTYFDGLHFAKHAEVMPSVYLGPEYSDDEIRLALDMNGLVYARLSDDDVVTKTATLIAGNNVIGWFQGRMEFGPRALGNRSIIADPRNKDNWQKVNLKIKFRESFRPFAPSVLLDRASEYFDIHYPSPYMLFVAPVKKDGLPAITHVDGSARIQTVTATENPRYYALIKEFGRITDCPVVINTSFNVRSEPIVMSPKDAINCFINTYMDYLVIGNYLVAKSDNKHLVNEDALKKYLGSFQID